MMDWQPIESIDDEPDPDVFHALLWGRLHVSGTDSKWITDWKVLKAAWVRWTGQSVNGSAKRSETWYVAVGGPCARIDRVEATHYMPLPDPPHAPIPL